MTCSSVRRRLVAFQDGELSPGEMTLVQEHLEKCASCSNLEERLARATPQPTLMIPVAVQLKMEAAVREALEEAKRNPEPVTEIVTETRAPSSASPLGRSWMRAGLYAALAALTVGWGATAWWSPSLSGSLSMVSNQQVAESRIAATPMPPDVYRPAAYVPTDSWF